MDWIYLFTITYSFNFVWTFICIAFFHTLFTTITVFVKSVCVTIIADVLFFDFHTFLNLPALSDLLQCRRSIRCAHLYRNSISSSFLVSFFIFMFWLAIHPNIPAYSAATINTMINTAMINTAILLPSCLKSIKRVHHLTFSAKHTVAPPHSPLSITNALLPMLCSDT